MKLLSQFKVYLCLNIRDILDRKWKEGSKLIGEEITSLILESLCTLMADYVNTVFVLKMASCSQL